MQPGRDLWWHELTAVASHRHTAKAFDAETPALHPLHERQHRQTQGRPPHVRRLPARHDAHLEVRLRSQGVRHLLVHRRRRLDHRPQLCRLRHPRQRRDEPHVRGRAQLPGTRPLLVDHRPARRHDFLHRAHRDPRVHALGRSPSEEAQPEIAPPARHGRRADQSRGLDVVLPGDRRQTLPDRRHVVADGDRRHHDHAARRRDSAETRFRNPAVLRGRAQGRGRPRRGGAAQHRAASSSSPARGPRCCARSGATTIVSSASTGPSSPADPTSTSPATAAGRTRTDTSGSSDASTTCSTSRATASAPPRSKARL